MRRKHYIESPKHWKDMYTRASVNDEWKPMDKVPISRIRVDKGLLAFPNDVDFKHVHDMIDNFDQDVWIPILVNQYFYLLDGQHRLTVAKKMRLKYIDVIIEDRELLEQPLTRKKTALELLPI